MEEGIVERVNRLIQEIDERWEELKQLFPEFIKKIEEHEERLQALEKVIK